MAWAFSLNNLNGNKYAVPIKSNEQFFSISSGFNKALKLKKTTTLIITRIAAHPKYLNETIHKYKKGAIYLGEVRWAQIAIAT
jgi:hypothetical protein